MKTLKSLFEDKKSLNSKDLDIKDACIELEKHLKNRHWDDFVNTIEDILVKIPNNKITLDIVNKYGGFGTVSECVVKMLYIKNGDVWMFVVGRADYGMDSVFDNFKMKDVLPTIVNGKKIVGTQDIAKMVNGKLTRSKITYNANSVITKGLLEEMILSIRKTLNIK